MGLIKCPDCKNQLSNTADACPYCGNKKFSIETGEMRKIRCPNCGGKGTWEDSGWWGKEVNLCGVCEGSGLMTQKERINLRNSEKYFM